jgi:hypothetical protein
MYCPSAPRLRLFEWHEMPWFPAVWRDLVVVAFCTPFIRPFTWRRLLWTYVVPVVPLVAMWDGLVSNLRTYSPVELSTLADALHGPAYRWRSGRVPSIGLSRAPTSSAGRSTSARRADRHCERDGCAHRPGDGADPIPANEDANGSAVIGAATAGGASYHGVSSGHDAGSRCWLRSRLPSDPDGRMSTSEVL